jgi:pimeloyl-ACP methyl ester carboxylesterase
MSFWESKLGSVVGVLLLAWVLAVGTAGFRVHRMTHPPRETDDTFDFGSMHIPVDRVQFNAPDGIPLSGWLIQGDPHMPPILLCHDLGASKASVVNLGIDLHERGYTVLLFDFRGHGASRGKGSTLGLDEKRDVLGALDWLGDLLGREPARVGVYGVGMGAHAAVLAAADRSSLRVLVLDGLYPDASYPLARSVFAGWQPGVRHLSFLSNGLFALMSRTRIGEHRAAEKLPGLLGRDLLLLAPEGDPELMAATQRMVESVPNQRDVDGNMVVLPVTQGDGLYGADFDRHREQVVRFFTERLTPGPVALSSPR